LRTKKAAVAAVRLVVFWLSNPDAGFTASVRRMRQGGQQGQAVLLIFVLAWQKKPGSVPGQVVVNDGGATVHKFLNREILAFDKAVLLNPALDPGR